MRILITGGAGFIGSHLADRWLAEGHRVTILNTLSDSAEANLRVIRPGASVVWGSITDQEVVTKTLRDHDVIVHLAARIHVDESIADPGSTWMANVLGAYNVLEAARRQGARVIYGSSCEVYGFSEALPIAEGAELRPHSPYAASKAAGDRLCYAYFKTYGLNVTVVRPSNVYGERQKKGVGGALIPTLVSRALAEKSLMVFGDGKQSREYLNVDDVVRAYDLILNRERLAGEAINVGSGVTVSILEIAQFIAARTGVKIEHAPARPGEVPAFLLDSSKVKRLGFSPQVSIWDGLDRYVQWQTSNSDTSYQTRPNPRRGRE
jgi:dTDP-glucose 4,6-dehydratase